MIQRKNYMSMKQKDAVFNAVVAASGTSEFSEAVTLSKDVRNKVQASLVQGFQAGEITYQGDASNKQKLTSYVSGLVSNWLRKDRRLNGNITYVAKNPGTRSGSGDDSVKAMRLLLATITDEADKAEIQAALDKRVAELKPKKVID